MWTSSYVVFLAAYNTGHFGTKPRCIHHIYKVETVGIFILLICLCVCVFVRLYLENGYTDLHQTWHAYSLRPWRKHRRVKTPDSILSSFPGEVGSCSSETKHEWRQDQSRLDYRNEHDNPEKLLWVRFPMKMVSVARKLSTVEERRQVQSCLIRRGDYKNKGHDTGKLSWVRVLTKMFSVFRKLITIEEWSQGQMCSFRWEDCRN
jgi:hypothetical protein